MSQTSGSAPPLGFSGEGQKWALLGASRSRSVPDLDSPTSSSRSVTAEDSGPPEARVQADGDGKEQHSPHPCSRRHGGHCGLARILPLVGRRYFARPVWRPTRFSMSRRVGMTSGSSSANHRSLVSGPRDTLPQLTVSVTEHGCPSTQVPQHRQTQRQHLGGSLSARISAATSNSTSPLVSSNTGDGHGDGGSDGLELLSGHGESRLTGIEANLRKFIAYLSTISVAGQFLRSA